MTTYDAIRHLLKQAREEASRHLEAAGASPEDRDAIEAFRHDLDRIIARMGGAAVSGGSNSLGTDLFALLQQCQGPLQPYRRFLEDAMSSTETVVE